MSTPTNHTQIRPTGIARSLVAALTMVAVGLGLVLLGHMVAVSTEPAKCLDTAVDGFMLPLRDIACRLVGPGA